MHFTQPILCKPKKQPQRRPSSVLARKGGPGTYYVAQCGSAGHNVRSKPNLKGTPVGRLAKGNKIVIIDEVCGRSSIYSYVHLWAGVYKFNPSCIISMPPTRMPFFHASGRI